MYLLDTDTLVNIIRRKPAVLANIRANYSVPKVFSIISYGELIHGCHKSWNFKESHNDVKQLQFFYPIIEVSLDIMNCFGEVKASLSRSGITIEDFDLLIGCTALTMNYTVVTNNIKHFGKIPNLKIVNWS